VAHFRYQNPAYNRTELPLTLARNPDLYVADEFHILGCISEAAILNSLLLIRHSRARKRPMVSVYLSDSQAGFCLQAAKIWSSGCNGIGQLR